MRSRTSQKNQGLPSTICGQRKGKDLVSSPHGAGLCSSYHVQVKPPPSCLCRCLSRRVVSRRESRGTPDTCLRKIVPLPWPCVGVDT